MATQVWRMGASEIASAIRDRQLKSRETVEAHLARIAEVNPKLNAITVVLADDALRAADAADAAVAAGDALGPLHGVPFTVKENIDLAGSATTQGIVAMEHAVPPMDAPHVAQLKAAGAIPIARTNMPDFGMRWHSDNALRGATQNPWDATRTPGGSSGGEAAALATGMTPLGVGNDYGGSLRWPSQCCGTAAIRPTLGRVPDASALAPGEMPITIQLFAVQGPMARHARDLRLALSCMSAPDARDPWYTPAPLAGPAARRRVAMTTDPAGEGVDPAVADGVRRAGKALADAGWDVVEADPPQVAAGRDAWARLVMAELQAVFAPMIEQMGSADAATFLKQAIGALPPAEYADYIGLLAERNRIARAWAQFAEEYPIVLGPVSAMQPFEVGFDIAGADEVMTLLRAHRLMVAINLLGLPSAVVPVGMADGLPQAVQLIGGRYREDLCLDAADAVEGALGTITPIDPR